MGEEIARRTPHELVFGLDGLDDRLFPPIAEEAAQRGAVLDDPERFLFLTSVGKLLRAVAGEPETGGESAAGEQEPEADEERGEVLKQHGRLLFHAFHFWRHGRRVLVLNEAAARALVDRQPAVGEWTLRPPAPAGYLQLPPNLFWAAPAPGMRPEPVDGFFWTLAEPPEAAAELHVLLALGLRPDRPGLSVVPAEGVLDDVAHWADAAGRPSGHDFHSTLPGGELDRLYSLETATEVLKLASLCFWHVAEHPETLGPEERAGSGIQVKAGRMPPSSLPYRRVGARG